MKHNHWVMHASFSPGGRLVATASWDGAAQVWDATTGEPVTPPLRHGSQGHTAAFSSDGRSLLTSSEDGTARLWTLRPDDRSAPDLQNLAQLLAGQQIDIAAGAVAVGSATLRAEWQRLRTRHPAAFVAPADAVLAWHQREADACLRGREWTAAVVHLNAALDADPRNGSLHASRGHAHAEMARWDRAAADFAHAIELGADDPRHWYWLALAQWAAGDTAGSRATYGDLVKRFGARTDLLTPYSIASLYSLLPNAGTDPAVPLRFAEGRVAANPSDYYWLTRLGGVLYRAGRYPEALRALEQADAVQPPRGHARHLFWRALCHARRGDTAEARQWLARGSAWLAEALERRRDKEPLGWEDRLQMELLRREVEALIREGSVPQ
jgi:tetratricopeptide (TPR) repeat protein